MSDILYVIETGKNSGSKTTVKAAEKYQRNAGACHRKKIRSIVRNIIASLRNTRNRLIIAPVYANIFVM